MRKTPCIPFHTQTFPNICDDVLCFNLALSFDTAPSKKRAKVRGSSKSSAKTHPQRNRTGQTKVTSLGKLHFICMVKYQDILKHVSTSHTSMCLDLKLDFVPKNVRASNARGTAHDKGPLPSDKCDNKIQQVKATVVDTSRNKKRMSLHGLCFCQTSCFFDLAE